MRSRAKRRQRTRRLAIISVVTVLAVLIVAGAYLLSTLSQPGSELIGKPVSSAVYQSLYASALGSYSGGDPTLTSKVTSYTGQPYSSNGKPVVVYIGADYCPYCAFQRWPLVMALMRFGNFSGLTYMLSSPTDVYPNSPTFTFVGSSYTSSYIVFKGYEQAGRAGQPLDSVPANYSQVFAQFGSSYPFLDIANRYVIHGPFYPPDLMQGKDWTQIAQLISTSSTLSREVIGSTNALTAAFCKVTGNVPSGVCNNPDISDLSATLTAFEPHASVSLMTGTPISTATAWATVQYGQIAPTRTSSAKIR